MFSELVLGDCPRSGPSPKNPAAPAVGAALLLLFEVIPLYVLRRRGVDNGSERESIRLLGRRGGVARAFVDRGGVVGALVDEVPG